MTEGQTMCPILKPMTLVPALALREETALRLETLEALNSYSDGVKDAPPSTTPSQRRFGGLVFVKGRSFARIAVTNPCLAGDSVL